MRVRYASSMVFAGLMTGGAWLVAQSGGSPKPLPSGATIQIITPGEIKWSDPPAGVARGTPSVEPGSSLQYAPLQGDPLKVGVPFAIASDVPMGTRWLRTGIQRTRISSS
jgi:hypothetical protein